MCGDEWNVLETSEGTYLVKINKPKAAAEVRIVGTHCGILDEKEKLFDEAEQLAKKLNKK